MRGALLFSPGCKRWFHSMSKFLIVGLGNVGAEYANTRHNIGFNVVDAFVQKHKMVFSPGRLADVAEIKWKGKTFICIKPTTFMNLSGKAFKHWMEKEKIPINQTLTIVDDLALPLSKIRLRPGGSAAGHNGLRNIEQALGTNQYARLRYGIGNEYPKGMQVEFVLGKWRREELVLVDKKIQACVEVIESFAFSGLENTMNTFNKIEFI